MTHKKIQSIMYNTGYVLRKLRLQKDVRQADVIAQTEINSASYSYMENGTRDIKLSHICVLAEYYGMKPCELVSMIEAGVVEPVKEYETKI